MKKMILGVVVLVSLMVQAEMKIYDGFAAGGSTPATGQYVSDPATTTGSNNDSILGQDPVLTGFDAGDQWISGDSVSTDLYPRIDDTGLEYTDGNGNKLLTNPGGLDISSGSSNGDFEVRRPTNISGALPNAGIFFSAIIQFGEGSAGMVRWTQGLGQTFQRDHYIGFTTNGTLRVGVYASNSVDHEGTTVYSPDTPHLVVVKWYETNSAGIWIDPLDISDLASEPRTVTYEDLSYVGNNSSYSLDYLKVKVNAMPGSSFQVDEIRFATTWLEVLPIFTPGGPLIETKPVSDVSFYDASLNGFLSSTGGAPTTVWAAWGESGSLSASTPLGNWPNSAIVSPDPMTNETADLTYVATNLLGDTAYTYTFFASNSWGIAGAPAVQYFTTLNDKPEISVDLPTEVTKNSFTLNSTLASTGTAPTTVWAVWDTSDHPAAAAPTEWPNSVELGLTDPGAVSNAVSGLIDEARYTYRFFATNVNGAAWTDAQLVLLDSPPALYDGFSGSATPDAAQYLTGTYPDDQMVGQSPLLNGFDDTAPWTSTYQYASTVYWQVRTNSLTYPGLISTPGSLRFFREYAGQGKSVAREAAVSVVSETWWVAFLLQYSDINGTAFTVKLNGGTLSDDACRIGISTSGHLNFTGGGTTATSQEMESVLSTNETHLVLLRFMELPDNYYADVDIWLDPVLTSSVEGLGTPDIADQSSLFSEYVDTNEPGNNIDVQHPFKRVALFSSEVTGPVNFLFDELSVVKSYDALPLEKTGGTIILLQ